MEPTVESPRPAEQRPPIEKKPSVVLEMPDLAKTGETVSEEEIALFVANGFPAKKRLIDEAAVVMFRAHRYEANWSPLPNFRDAVRQVVAEIEPVELVGGKGDVIFWHGRTVHSSGVHLGEDMWRGWRLGS